MDIQLVLVIILALLTINVLIVGIYVVFVLKDFRTTIKKTNEVLDGVTNVTHAASSMANALTSPISSIANFANVVTGSFHAVRSIRSLIHSPERLEDDDNV
jgi:hypothetical protein